MSKLVRDEIIMISDVMHMGINV